MLYKMPMAVKFAVVGGEAPLERLHVCAAPGATARLVMAYSGGKPPWSDVSTSVQFATVFPFVLLALRVA